MRRGEKVVVLGPSGSGQIDVYPHDKPPRPAPAGRHHSRRHRADERRQEHRRHPERGRHGVPVVQPVPAPDRNGQYHPGADEGQEMAPCAGGGSGHRLPREGRHSGAGRQVPRRALGRSAAAGGDRAGARHAAQDHAVRRADFGPGPRDDQGSSGRPAGARHVRHDDDHRHPRSRLRQGKSPTG